MPCSSLCFKLSLLLIFPLLDCIFLFASFYLGSTLLVFLSILPFPSSQFRQTGTKRHKQADALCVFSFLSLFFFFFFYLSSLQSDWWKWWRNRKDTKVHEAGKEGDDGISQYRWSHCGRGFYCDCRDRHVLLKCGLSPRFHCQLSPEALTTRRKSGVCHVAPDGRNPPLASNLLSLLVLTFWYWSLFFSYGVSTHHLYRYLGTRFWIFTVPKASLKLKGYSNKDDCIDIFFASLPGLHSVFEALLYFLYAFCLFTHTWRHTKTNLITTNSLRWWWWIGCSRERAGRIHSENNLQSISLQQTTT